MSYNTRARDRYNLLGVRVMVDNRDQCFSAAALLRRGGCQPLSRLLQTCVLKTPGRVGYVLRGSTRWPAPPYTLKGLRQTADREACVLTLVELQLPLFTT